MAVRVRLSRFGKKKHPFYRIVAIDSRSKRDGRFLEDLGTYNPISGEIVQFHGEQLEAWISKGAIPSEAVEKIQKMYKKRNAVTV